LESKVQFNCPVCGPLAPYECEIPSKEFAKELNRMLKQVKVRMPNDLELSLDKFIKLY